MCAASGVWLVRRVACVLRPELAASNSISKTNSWAGRYIPVPHGEARYASFTSCDYSLEFDMLYVYTKYMSVFFTSSMARLMPGLDGVI
jgi:hypothetical protein